MRQLSRLLSVFMALILLATSFVVASAHTGDSTAKITIARVDTESDVHVGTKLKFLVIIERGDHDIFHDAKIRSVYAQDNQDTPTPSDATDDTPSAAEVDLSSASGVMAAAADDGTYTADEVALTGTSPVGTIAEFVYTVQSGELGAAQQRNIPIQFQLTVADASRGSGDLHTNADLDATSGNEAFQIKSNTVNVLVTKDPGTGDGASEVMINVAIERPDEIAAGNKVKFTVSSETGKHPYGPKPLIISKQLYNEDGDKDGGLVAVAVFTLAQLQSNSVSAEASKEYTLVQDDVDASKVEFSYAAVITAADLGLTGDAADRQSDDKTQTDTFLLVELVVEPEPEATPDPNISKTDAATVMRGEGNVIHIDPAAGPEFSLSLGILGIDGTLIPESYIRDNDLGQTYAVVTRESDGEIVRVWISSHSPFVGDIDWDSVLTFYNHPVDVVNAIALDHTTPSENQLVDTGVKWYVYLAGKWRHIPDIPTFQSRGFFYCDLTTASADWVDNVDLGQALPSEGGEEQVGYPSCR